MHAQDSLFFIILIVFVASSDFCVACDCSVCTIPRRVSRTESCFPVLPRRCRLRLHSPHCEIAVRVLTIFSLIMVHAAMLSFNRLPFSFARALPLPGSHPASCRFRTTLSLPGREVPPRENIPKEIPPKNLRMFFSGRSYGSQAPLPRRRHSGRRAPPSDHVPRGVSSSFRFFFSFARRNVGALTVRSQGQFG